VVPAFAGMTSVVEPLFAALGIPTDGR